MLAVEERGRTVVKQESKDRPVRVTAEAMKWARIASGYTGETLADYVSRSIVERAREDVERLHAKVAEAPAPAARKPGRSKGA